METNFIIKKNKIHSIDKKLKLISIENSIFRCSGGGQDADQGEIHILELKKSFNVIPIKKDNNITKLRIEHENLFNQLKEDMIIEERVNKKLRKIQSKTHSAEHLLISQIKKLNKKDQINLGKVNIENGYGDIHIKTNIEKMNLFNLLKEAQLNANKLIQKGKKIKIHEFKKEEIDNLNDKFPKLRIKKERISDDIIKIVEIEGVDYSACKGTHVKNISEIKHIGIIDINKNNKEYKIRFSININEINKLKDTLLEFKLINDLQIENINGSYQNLINERNHFRKKVNEMLPLIWNLSKEVKYKDKNYQLIKLKDFKVNKLMRIINNQKNFIIINVTDKGTNVISEGIDLSFLSDYKGKMSKKQSILFINDENRKKLEKKINKKEIDFII